MAKHSLKKMSVAELAALRDEVQSALAAKVAAEMSALQEQIEGLAKLEGGAAPLRGRPVKKGAPAAKSSRGGRKLGKVAPKYRGPKGELWTGRGRSPRWLAALEGDGKKRESYLIK